MLKARLTTKDGTAVVVLGLTRENVVKLQDGQPIAVDMAELDAGQGILVITYGVTLPDVVAQLQQVAPNMPNVREPRPGESFRVEPDS